LVSKNANKKNVIKISELLKSIDSLTQDYLHLQKKFLGKQYNTQFTGFYFDINQEQQLLNKHKEYFELWMKQLKSYIENNLYLNTRKGEIKDTLNRNLIFHALEDNIDYSFQSYLRLFNCISFLSWALGLVNEECSVLSIANEEDVKDKWTDYLKILAASEALTETKSQIYGRKIDSFKKYLPKEYLPFLKLPEAKMRDALINFDLMKKVSRPTFFKTIKLILFYLSVKKERRKAKIETKISGRT
jgi:hypothetical protein